MMARDSGCVTSVFPKGDLPGVSSPGLPESLRHSNCWRCCGMKTPTGIRQRKTSVPLPQLFSAPRKIVLTTVNLFCYRPLHNLLEALYTDLRQAIYGYGHSMATLSGASS